MTTKLDLTVADIEKAIKFYIEKEHSMGVDKISFKVSDTADDRFGGGPRYELVSAEVKIKGTTNE